jgi:hypothetical protein
MTTKAPNETPESTDADFQIFEPDLETHGAKKALRGKDVTVLAAVFERQVRSEFDGPCDKKALARECRWAAESAIADPNSPIAIRVPNPAEELQNRDSGRPPAKPMEVFPK